MVNFIYNESDFANKSSVEIFDGLMDKYNGDEQLAFDELEHICKHNDGYNQEITDAKEAFERIIRTKNESSLDANLSEARRFFSPSQYQYISDLAKFGLSLDFLFKPWHCEASFEDDIKEGVIIPVKFDLKNDEVLYYDAKYKFDGNRGRFEIYDKSNETTSSEMRDELETDGDSNKTTPSKMSIDNFLKLCLDNPDNKNYLKKFLPHDDIARAQSNQNKEVLNWVKTVWNSVDFRNLFDPKKKDKSKTVDNLDITPESWFNGLNSREIFKVTKLYRDSQGDAKKAQNFINVLIKNRKSKNNEDPNVAFDEIPTMESTLLVEKSYNLDGDDRNIVNAIFKLCNIDTEYMIKPLVMINKPILNRQVKPSFFKLSYVDSKESVYLDEVEKNGDKNIVLRFSRKPNEIISGENINEFKKGLTFRLIDLDDRRDLDLNIDKFEKLIEHQSKLSKDELERAIIRYSGKLNTKTNSSWTFVEIVPYKVKDLLYAYMQTNSKGKLNPIEPESIEEIENNPMLYSYTSDENEILRRVKRVEHAINNGELIIKKDNSADKSALVYAKEYVQAHNQANFLYRYKTALASKKPDSTVTRALKLFCNENGSDIYSVVPIDNRYFIQKPRLGASTEDMTQDLPQELYSHLKRRANQ